MAGRINADVSINGVIRKTQSGTLLSELLDIDMPCGGHGKCGKCKVKVSGEVSMLSDVEKSKLTPSEIMGAM